MTLTQSDTGCHPTQSRVTAVALAVSCAMFAALAPQALAADGSAPAPQEIGLLFVQTAPSGTLKPVAGKRNRYVLTLRNVGRQMVWFSDRPARQQGHVPVSTFPHTWKGLGFAADPPNAALTLLDGKVNADTVVLTLGKPVYNAERRTIRYSARRLSRATGNLSGHEPRADRRVPRSFKSASLFIDDASAPVYSGCVIQPYSTCRWTSFENADLHGLDIRHAYWPGADLTGANMSGANLSGSYIYSARADWANLQGANLAGSSWEGSRLGSANLRGASLPGANLKRAQFGYADLTGADLTGANLSGADLTDAWLMHANFTRADLTGVKVGPNLPWLNATCPNGRVANVPPYGCSVPQ